jgi:hypothetical protein
MRFERVVPSSVVWKVSSRAHARLPPTLNRSFLARWSPTPNSVPRHLNLRPSYIPLQERPSLGQRDAAHASQQHAAKDRRQRESC